MSTATATAIPEDNAWKLRELARFNDGTYKPVPWDLSSWHRGSEHYQIHFAHVSTDDPEMVAFTQSADKGQRDIQTRMRPGRYLSKFFRDVLDESAIKHWAETFAKENTVAELKFADTADEVERVYVNGPNSCMSKPAAHYASSCHPARVYAAGDLAIAYIEPAKGEVTGRALCWPEKKVFARIYGDTSRLEGQLEAAGFVAGGREDFAGARLLRIEEDDGEFVCPYLDVCGGVDDDGEFLILSEYGAEYSADRTDGLCGEEKERCARCGDSMSRDDTYNVSDDDWCEYCYQNYSGYCEDCNSSYHNDYITGVGDHCVCDDCLRRNYTCCDECDEYHSNDDVTRVWDRHRDVRDVCEGCLEEDYTYCDECDKHHHNDRIVSVDDETYCEDCAPEPDEEDEGEGDESDTPCGTIADPRQIDLPIAESVA